MATGPRTLSRYVSAKWPLIMLGLGLGLGLGFGLEEKFVNVSDPGPNSVDDVCDFEKVSQTNSAQALKR